MRCHKCNAEITSEEADEFFADLLDVGCKTQLAEVRSQRDALAAAMRRLIRHATILLDEEIVEECQKALRDAGLETEGGPDEPR